MTILPQLEDDLFNAAKRRLPAPGTPDGTRGRPRRSDTAGGWSGVRGRLATTARTVPVLLAIVVTVIIAAFALTLSHRGHRPRPVTPTTSVQDTRQQLIHLLGVLRRPQTKGDLDPELDPGFLGIASIPGQFARRHQHPPPGLERRLTRLGDPKLDQPLVRVVEIPAWGAKVGIEPATWQPSPSSPQRSEGLELELWIGSKPTIPPSSDGGTGARPTSIDTLRTHGLALTDKVLGTKLLDGVLLVPDSVAKITLHVTRVIRSPVKIDPSQFGTATATVHENIATFQLAIPAVSPKAAGPNTVSGMFGTSAVAQTTWFDASGNVIRHTTTSLDVLIKVLGKRGLAGPPRGAPRRQPCVCSANRRP